MRRLEQFIKDDLFVLDNTIKFKFTEFFTAHRNLDKNGEILLEILSCIFTIISSVQDSLLMITRNAIIKLISRKQGRPFFTCRPRIIQSRQNFRTRRTIAISRVARNDYRESYGAPSRGSSFRMLRVLFTRKKSFIITVNWPAGLRS